MAPPARPMILITEVPARLSWGPRDENGHATTVPGRGEAGWTVYTFETATDAAAFVRAYRHAAMPCWARFRLNEAGELCEPRPLTYDEALSSLREEYRACVAAGSKW